MTLGRLAIGVAAAALLAPAPARAQLSEPCAALCGATLLGVGAVAATGTVASVARLKGGLSTTAQGLWTWGTSFAVVVGSGVALSGNGERQERAIYAAALGSAVGGAVGLGVALFTEGDDGARRLASTLVGAAAGALIGGVYGALSHDDHIGDGYAIMSFEVGF